MNIDILKLIVCPLPIKYRLVCREWSKLIPYNVNKLRQILNKKDTFEILKEEFENTDISTIINTIFEDRRISNPVRKCDECNYEEEEINMFECPSCEKMICIECAYLYCINCNNGICNKEICRREYRKNYCGRCECYGF